MIIPNLKYWQWYVFSILYDTWQLIKEILLMFLSFLFIPFAIIGIIYTFIKHLLKWDYSLSKQLKPIVRAISLLNDGFANASAGELLNDVTKPVVKYGKWYQTISAISGVNYFKMKTFEFKNYINKLFGKGHCENAITEEQKCYFKIQTNERNN